MTWRVELIFIIIIITVLFIINFCQTFFYTSYLDWDQHLCKCPFGSYKKDKRNNRVSSCCAQQEVIGSWLPIAPRCSPSCRRHPGVFAPRRGTRQKGKKKKKERQLKTRLWAKLHFRLSTVFPTATREWHSKVVVARRCTFFGTYRGEMSYELPEARL